MALLESKKYDVELAGSELLGRDAARIRHEETRIQIRAILSSEQLVDQLVRQTHRTGFDEDPDVEGIAKLLKQFPTGFLA